MIHATEPMPQRVAAQAPSPARFTLAGLSQDRLAALVLALLAVVAVVVSLVTGNSYDTGDSLMHYLFAHWAWKHPNNLLDTWAKPLFTLLAAGPASFGFGGMVLFQCGVVAWSAWLAYTIARRLQVPAPVLAIVFCYASPDYFRIQHSGLTEPLFGLVLVGAVSLALHGRYRWSAAVLSWLPLVRSEGIALWGLWVVFLLLERQWKALPWLALGMGVYSFVGGFFRDFNFAWLFTNNPYSFHSQYGSGDWYHFLIYFPTLLSWPLTVLLLLGIGATIWRMRQGAAWRQPAFRGEILLLDGSIVLFTLLQSVFWAYGLFGSFGMTRVMTVLVPLLAVVCLRGLTSLSELSPRPVVRRLVLAAGVLAVVGLLFKRDYGIRLPGGELIGYGGNLHWRRDFKPIGDAVVAREAAEWLRQYNPNWAWRPVAYQQLNFGIALNVDAFDPEARIPMVVNDASNIDAMPVGTYLYWDEFWASGPEGHLPLDVISKDTRFRKLWEGSALHSDYDPNWHRRGILYERVQ